MNWETFDPLLRRFLAEDLGFAGDITTEAVVPPGTRCRAEIVARRGGVIAGLPLVERILRLVGDGITVENRVAEGERVAAGTVLARLEGPARALLTGERTALNLLSRLSGVATVTADLVARVADTRARIADTRKTTPGLRVLEKYAVRVGGGVNHRFGLYDAVLIKDNHLALAGGVKRAVEAARARVGHVVKIEVEVENLRQLEEALEIGVDAVLCDNMDLATLRRVVERVGGRIPVEASGGITPESVRAVAETGVDLISVGWLTHSSPALDVALDVVL